MPSIYLPWCMALPMCDWWRLGSAPEDPVCKVFSIFSSPLPSLLWSLCYAGNNGSALRRSRLVETCCISWLFITFPPSFSTDLPRLLPLNALANSLAARSNLWALHNTGCTLFLLPTSHPQHRAGICDNSYCAPSARVHIILSGNVFALQSSNIFWINVNKYCTLIRFAGGSVVCGLHISNPICRPYKLGAFHKLINITLFSATCRCGFLGLFTLAEL